MRARSVVELIALAELLVVDHATRAALCDFSARLHRFLQVRPEYAAVAGEACLDPGAPYDHVLSVLTAAHVARVLEAVSDTGAHSDTCRISTSCGKPNPMSSDPALAAWWRRRRTLTVSPDP